jgi:putative DNA primase/helicase
MTEWLRHQPQFGSDQTGSTDGPDITELARALGGQVVGSNQVLAPGPFHSAQDRSLSVRLDPSAPNGFIVHSFAFDDFKECRDYVRERLQAWFIEDGKGGWTISAGLRSEPKENAKVEPNYRAVCLWREAEDPRGTSSERYLRARGLDLTDNIAGAVLRHHPRCTWAGDAVPALIAAFRLISTNELVAIHRIRCDVPGRWPKTERKMLGPVRRAAVKLDPIRGEKLAIGEGVETCLAARQLGFGPVWALGSAAAIASFPLLPDVMELTILGEAGQASHNAITECGERWRAAGRRVRVAIPDDGADDFNAQIMRSTCHDRG